MKKNIVFLEATIPRLQIVYLTKVAQMLSSLRWIKHPIALEILLLKGLTLFFFVAREEDAVGFANALYGHIDWIDLKRIEKINIDKERGLAANSPDYDDYIEIFDEKSTKIQFFTPIKGITEPFNNDLSYQFGDPLSTLLSPFSNLKDDEKVLIQILIYPIRGKGWEKVVKKRARDILYNSGMYSESEKIIKNVLTSITNMTGIITGADYYGNPMFPASQEQILPIEQKALQDISYKVISQPFLTEIKLIIDSKTRLEKLIDNGSAAIISVFNDINGLKKAKRINLDKKWDLRKFMYKPFWMFNIELARVFRPPTFFTIIEGIKWAQAKQLPIPPNVSTSPPFIGIGVYRNETKVVGIDETARTHHFFIDGKTGTGKSTFLVNFILQLIANNKESLIFIDPHGDAVQNILQAYPEERVDDLIYIDFSSDLNPVTINIITPVEDMDPTVHVANLIEIFQMKWADSWGPRMEWILREVITAMSFVNYYYDVIKNDEEIKKEFPNFQPFTIQDVLIVLSLGSHICDEKRKMLYKTFEKCPVNVRIKDEVINFIEPDSLEKNILRDPKISDSVSAIKNKLTVFTLNKSLLSLTGFPFTNISFYDIVLGIDTDKYLLLGDQKIKIDPKIAYGKRKYIVLVNVSKGSLAASADLIGTILVNMISQAVYSRAKLQQKGMIDLLPTISLIIDEFQNFTTPSIATLLSEVRKYKVSIVLATQFLGNLSASMSMRDPMQIKRLTESILANCRNDIIFQTEIEDGHMLAYNFGERTIFPTDFAQLPKYTSIVKIMKERESLTPFLVEMLPMLHIKGQNLVKDLIKINRVMNKDDIYEFYRNYPDVPLSEREAHKNKIIGLSHKRLLTKEKIPTNLDELSKLLNYELDETTEKVISEGISDDKIEKL